MVIPICFLSITGILFVIFETTLLAMHLIVRRTMTMGSFMHCTYQSFAIATTVNFGLQLLQVASSEVVSTQANGANLSLAIAMSGLVLIGGGMMELYFFIKVHILRRVRVLSLAA